MSRAARRFEPAGLMALVLLMAGPPAVAKAVRSREARESPRPSEERRIVDAPRATLTREREQRVRDERSQRVAMQIPQALRSRVEARVRARIDRNLARAQELRTRAMGMLEELVAELPRDAPEMPASLLRLGELQWEAERDEFLAAFKAWEAKPADQRGEPPTARYSLARSQFAHVLTDYPDFERYDLALYIDGFLATEEGETQQALERFNRILAEHPQSPFVSDAHMVRAEAEFEKERPDYAFALVEYEAVLRDPTSEAYDLALFKSAWTLWRLGQAEEAAKRFLQVFRAATERSSMRSQKELDELQEQALKNLVAVFVEDEKNTAEEMHQFLVKAGGERFAGEIVRALAETLYEQAHFTRGIEAYRLLLRLAPTDPEAYRFALAIAAGHSTLEEWKELSLDYRWLLEEYATEPPERATPGAAGEATAEHPADPLRPRTLAWRSLQEPAVLAAAEQAAEAQLFADALGLHAKAQADATSVAEFESTAALYRIYTDFFPRGEHAYEAYFNLGEIHFHRLAHAIDAADAYLAAVRVEPEGKWSKTALYNSLAALEAAREQEFSSAAAAKERQRETPTDKKLTEAMELYASTYPDDPELPAMLFRQGQLYYDYQVFDVAVRQWGLLLEKHPQSPHAREAGELILDSFNRSEDYDNIEVWGRRLLSAPAFQAPEGQKRLKTLIVQAIFKQGQQLSSASKHDLAAAAYLRAAREFPTDTRAAKAAVNAVIEADRAMDLELVRESAELLLEAHRSSGEAAGGVWAAAKAHQRVGLLAEAAGYYEGLARHFAKSDHHRDAAYNAVLLWTTLAEREQAVAAGKLFQRAYPKGDDADEVSFLLGQAHERAEDWRAAERLYEGYWRKAKLPSRQIEALVRLAVARLELGDERGARAALNRAVKQHDKHSRSLDDRGKYFGARARYLQAQRLVAQYERIEITGDVKQLGARLKRKAGLLKRASTALLETAKLGVAEWTTASLYQVGFVYESFAKALLSSPPPESLSEQEREEFQMQIDEFVIPIEEKALEAYETGWLKALELGIFNRWTAKMRTALGRLNTEEYPPVRELGLSMGVEASAALPPLIATTRRTPEGGSQRFLMVEVASPLPSGKGPRTQAPARGGDRVSRSEAR